jgi:hypothetical protein
MEIDDKYFEELLYNVTLFFYKAQQDPNTIYSYTEEYSRIASLLEWSFNDDAKLGTFIDETIGILMLSKLEYDDFHNTAILRVKPEKIGFLKQTHEYLSEFDNDFPTAMPSPFEVIESTIKAFHHDSEISISLKPLVTELRPEWRKDLKDHREHNEAVNHCQKYTENHPVKEHNGAKYRSNAEIRIAKELEKKEVIFFPGNLAKIQIESGKFVQKEPDFLVLYKGKWGMLEIDGPFHSGKAAQDHSSDRFFKIHGLKVIERFPEEDVMEDAPQIIEKFLSLIEKNG